MASTSRLQLSDEEEEDNNFDGWSSDEDQAQPCQSLFSKHEHKNAEDCLQESADKYGVDLVVLYQQLGLLTLLCLYIDCLLV